MDGIDFLMNRVLAHVFHISKSPSNAKLIIVPEPTVRCSFTINYHVCFLSKDWCQKAWTAVQKFGVRKL